MMTGIKEPSLEEMEAILKSAAACLECDATECHEFTPEGVDVCSRLPFWENRPVPRSILLEWQKIVSTKNKC
jgi:hypothetical protein